MEKPGPPAARAAATLNRYLLKLPLTLVLIMVGFLLEAAIAWPFALLCRLHRRSGPL